MKPAAPSRRHRVVPHRRMVWSWLCDLLPGIGRSSSSHWRRRCSRSLCRGQGCGFCLIDLDRVAQARNFKDVLVMIAQSIGQHMLFLSIDANEQGDEQANSATVHVLQPAEVQDDDAGSWSA